MEAAHQDDGTFGADEIDMIPSVVTASLYGLGSILAAINVVNNPQPEESILHLIIRLLPQFMFASAALIHAVIAYDKHSKKVGG